MTDNNNEYNNALPQGYMLDNFRIIKVLGAGGFGVAYLAEDTYLDEQCVIKEYMPSEFSYRDTTSHSVYATSPSQAKNYEWGLTEFLNEAKMIKKCQHHNIVKVIRFFEANNTAYMVMPYFAGSSLDEFIKARTNKSLSEQELKDIILPLLDGLKVLHAQNIFHRDIKPSNIYICDEDHRPILIDFGAARFSLGARSRSITSIVTIGYSPHEQYHQHGRQGAWTDIYAIAAVMYCLISGKKPIEAPARVSDDPLVPAVEVGKGNYSPHLLAAIDHALAFSEKDRPQTIEEWLLEMEGKAISTQQTTINTTTGGSQPSEPTHKNNPKMAWILGIVALVVVGVLAALFYPRSPEPIDPDMISNKFVDTSTSSVTPSISPPPRIPKEPEPVLPIAIKEEPVEPKPEPVEPVIATETKQQCTAGRLNASQIRALVTNKIAIGTRLDTPKPYDWQEFQMSNGDALFSKKNSAVSRGKWKIEDDKLCWCYGECASYKCKYVETSDQCSEWYYIDPDSEKKTGKVYDWQEITP